LFFTLNIVSLLSQNHSEQSVEGCWHTVGWDYTRRTWCS